jgi:hypothetical protein
MAEALGKAKINIMAFMTDEAEGQSRVRLVTDSPAKAGKTVTGLSLRFSEEEVVGVILANKPGTVAEAAGKLGNAGINIKPRLHRVRSRLEETAGRLCRERSEASREDFEMNDEQFSMDCRQARAENEKG